jgi:hypothetical protein
MPAQHGTTAIRAVYLAAYVMAILLGVLLDGITVRQQVGLAVLIMLLALATDQYLTRRASKRGTAYADGN